MKGLRSRYREWGILALFALAAGGVGILLRDIAFDDPFVTYRYAENLATGAGFVYNPDERVLSTTAPLYALLLAVGRFLGAGLPTLSNIIGIAALAAGAWLIYRICRHFGWDSAGVVAGLLYATFPLLWLSMGFEVPFYLALVLAAYALHFEGRTVWAAVLLGAATLTRADGVIPTGVILLHATYQQRRLPWKPGAAYALTLAPLIGFLTAYFGSPVPVTLAAKNAQTVLGVTGFYAGTKFAQGALILAKAWFAQTPLYLLLACFCVLGLIVSVWRTRWALLLAAWAALYGLGYHLLGVAPYHWYYAPFVPAGMVTAGLGVEWLGRRARRPLLRAILVGVLGVALLLPQTASLLQMERVLHGDAGPSPDAPTYKVLPEVKTDVYRQVGEWLRANTAADADVGVTEVGVIGYYSQRRMIDFLGLLRPEVAQALRRNDVAWALFHYQPDYLALTETNPLYSYDIRRDEWFRAAYEPVEQFADPRFWAGPVTVYRRTVPRTPMGDVAEVPGTATALNLTFGSSVRLLAYELAEEEVRPGEPLDVTLYWRTDAPVTEEFSTFVHILGEHDLVVAQRDGIPCMGSCPTSTWEPGQVVADRVLVALPRTAYAPDQAQLEVGLVSTEGERLLVYTASGEATGDNARFGGLRIAANPGSLPNPQGLNFGNQIALVGYDVDRRAIRAGDTLHVSLYWKALESLSHDYTVFLHLLGEGIDVWGYGDGPPAGGSAPTSQWQPGQVIRDDRQLVVDRSTPAGAWTIELGLFDQQTGQRLDLLDVDGHVFDTRVLLTKVRVWP